MTWLHHGEVARVTNLGQKMMLDWAESFNTSVLKSGREVRKQLNFVTPQLLVALPVIKTLSMGVQMDNPPPTPKKKWGLKLLLSSVIESTLHVSLIWCGVAKLVVESHVLGCTFQCDFIAVQFFAEKSKSWN